MKKHHIVIINIVFISMMAWTINVVYAVMTGAQPLSALSALWQKPNSTVDISAACSTQQKIKDLASSENSSLRSLDVFQEACDSYVSNTMMIFFSLPSTSQHAGAYAENDAKILKEFHRLGIRPLVIVEPSNANGALIDFALIANGTYNDVFAEYFSTLKTEGITESMMGIWNPLPEANLPNWKNNQPDFFAPAFSNYVEALRKQFPTAKTSILLNSATYETTDFEWLNGDYSSLRPYYFGIKPGLVTYAGVQGFPWISRQGGSGSILNATEFLAPNLLTEMANDLGTKKIWFNTGTFSQKYTLDETDTRTITPERRKEILNTIQNQAVRLRNAGYEVSISLFSQDKSNDLEATNWSYWEKEQHRHSMHVSIFTDFAKNMLDQKIDVWLFDK